MDVILAYKLYIRECKAL